MSIGLTALFIRVISDFNYISEIKKNIILTKYLLPNNISLVTTNNFFRFYLFVIIIRYFISLMYFNNIYNVIFNFSTSLNSILANAIFKQDFFKLKSEKFQSTKNIFFKEIEYYITYFIQPLLLLLPDIFQVFFLILFLFILLPKTSILILIILFIFIYIINKIIKFKVLEISKLLTTHQRNRTLVLGNFYSNILFWRVKNLFNNLESFFTNENRIISKSSSDLNFYQQVPRLTYEFFIYFIFSIVALMNKNNYSQVFTSFIIMSLATIKLLPSAVKFSSFLQSSLSAKYIINTLNEILNKEDNIDSNRLDLEIVEFKDKIELQNAVFKYHEKLILNDCSFCFYKNDIISISGPSGSGKSTLIEILLSQHHLNNGKYLFDGTDITNLKVDFSKIVGIVPQSIQFINDTLRSNLVLSNKSLINDNEIIKVLNQCNLKNLLESLPLGLETIIDNNMNQFSGGERQRIAIARCLLDKNVKILFFDEITSALDNYNSNILLNTIMNFKGIYTMIFITHDTQIRSYCNVNYEFINGKLKLIQNLENKIEYE